MSHALLTPHESHQRIQLARAKLGWGIDDDLTQPRGSKGSSGRRGWMMRGSEVVWLDQPGSVFNQKWVVEVFDISMP